MDLRAPLTPKEVLCELTGGPIKQSANLTGEPVKGRVTNRHLAYHCPTDPEEPNNSHFRGSEVKSNPYNLNPDRSVLKSRTPARQPHLLDVVVRHREGHSAGEEDGLDDGDEDERRRQLEEAGAQDQDALRPAPGRAKLSGLELGPDGDRGHGQGLRECAEGVRQAGASALNLEAFNP